MCVNFRIVLVQLSGVLKIWEARNEGIASQSLKLHWHLSALPTSLQLEARNHVALGWLFQLV